MAVLRFWLGSLPATWKATAPDENFLAVWAEHRTGIELEVRIGYRAPAERHFVIEGDFPAITLHQQQRHPEPLASGLEHFAHCIRTGCAPICGGPESIEITRVLQEIAPLPLHSLSSSPFRTFAK